jgi:hypothetical protein
MTYLLKVTNNFLLGWRLQRVRLLLITTYLSFQAFSPQCRAFNFGEFVNGKAQQPLPPTIAGDEPQIQAFADSCHKLCKKLLHLLGIGLGVSGSLSKNQLLFSTKTINLGW